MKWLSNPKVRLALIVNGLYFVSLFTTPSPRDSRPHFFAQARESLAARESRARHDYVPPPPPAALSHMSAYESGGRFHVSLTKDLTLVKRPGRTLVLTPALSVPTHPQDEPFVAVLNFILYSDKEDDCPGGCSLVIAADRVVVWPEYAREGAPGLLRERIPGEPSKLPYGRAVETMNAELLTATMSYEQFDRIVNAKGVTITLGPDRVGLTAQQVETLREMVETARQMHLARKPAHSGS